MLRPVDLYVMAYLATGPSGWTQSSIGTALHISQSNVHRALKQLRACQLLSASDRPLLRPFRDLLVHAVRHIYPAELGPPGRGLPTAHSAPMLAHMVRASDALVWPSDQGTALGTTVSPLHDRAPRAALANPRLHELLALIDIFRLGRVRERQQATAHLDALLAEYA